MSSLLRSSKTKLFSSSLSRTFSSLSNHRLSPPPQIGTLPPIFQLFHRNTTFTSHGNENPPSKGNSSDIVNPSCSEFGKLCECDLPSMNDPFSKLGIGSNKTRPMVLMNKTARDTMLAGAGYHTINSKVWDAKGPMPLGVRSVDADMFGLTGHKRSMSDIASSETKPYTFRPLSPHLPVYQPQLSSTLSIFNRISGALLASVILLFYMIYMKMGLISLTYDSFYQFLFYSSKLNLLAIELSALALSYHLYMGIRHLVH